MTATDGFAFLDADGSAAPPRSNGELVFRTPWESRVFGVTIALFRAGLFQWDEFRSLLIEEIAAADRGDAEPSYYVRWQAALERLLAQKNLCGASELDTKLHDLAARPSGHDHSE